MPKISEISSLQSPLYLRKSDVAKIFKTSTKTVDRWETRDRLILPKRINSRRILYSLEDLAKFSHKRLWPVDVDACRNLGMPEDLIIKFHLPSACSERRSDPGHQYLYRRQEIAKELWKLPKDLPMNKFPELYRALSRGLRSQSGAQLLDCLAAILAQAAHNKGDFGDD